MKVRSLVFRAVADGVGPAAAFFPCPFVVVAIRGAIFPTLLIPFIESGLPPFFLYYSSSFSGRCGLFGFFFFCGFFFSVAHFSCGYKAFVFLLERPLADLPCFPVGAEVASLVIFFSSVKICQPPHNENSLRCCVERFYLQTYIFA